MKTITEFSGSVLREAARLRGEAAEGTEQPYAALGLAEDRLARLLEALDVAKDRVADVRRVRVMQLAEGEAPPHGAVKHGDHVYLIEFPVAGSQSRGRDDRRQRRGRPDDGMRRDREREPPRNEVPLVGAGWMLSRAPDDGGGGDRRGRGRGGPPGDRRGPPRGDRRGPPRDARAPAGAPGSPAPSAGDRPGGPRGPGRDRPPRPRREGGGPRPSGGPGGAAPAAHGQGQGQGLQPASQPQQPRPPRGPRPPQPSEGDLRPHVGASPAPPQPRDPRPPRPPHPPRPPEPRHPPAEGGSEVNGNVAPPKPAASELDDDNIGNR